MSLELLVDVIEAVPGWLTVAADAGTERESGIIRRQTPIVTAENVFKAVAGHEILEDEGNGMLENAMVAAAIAIGTMTSHLILMFQG